MKDGCVFCDYTGPSPIRLTIGPCYVIDPLNPVTEGHLLVIPFKHVRHAADDRLMTASAFGVAAEVAKMAMDYAEYESFNLITSAGRAATQTVDHLHVHIVPRWTDDGLALPWSLQEVGGSL